MAGSNYLSNPNNSFFAVEEDDVDDDTFLRNSRQAQTQKLQDIEDRALKSAQASISILRDTEDIGVRTAEELLVQREQLERTEKHLDDINDTLRFSQKHINGIKSVFGSIKNYWSGKQEQRPGSSTPSSSSVKDSGSQEPGYSSNASRKLTSALDSKPSQEGPHPGMRIRGLSDEPEEEPAPAQNQIQSRYRRVNDILDQNIDEVGASLSRLKGLAEGLGEELVSQNSLLERIDTKVERADISIKRQNRDMTRLLK